MSCELREHVAAYVLDALEPDEAAMVREHLSTCDVCQAELTAVSWIPPLLPLVDVEAVERLDRPAAEEPSPRLLDRLMAEIGREARTPRGRRAAATVGAVALLAAVGTASTVAGVTSHNAGPRSSTVKAVDPRTHVQAAVTVSGRSWGTEFGLTLSGAYPNGTCSLVVRSDDGRSETAATWVASPHGSANVPGATAIPASQVRELDVVTGTGYQLVRIVLPH
jgi:Putative zinc-finger